MSTKSQHTRFEFNGATVFITESDLPRYDGATVYTISVDGVHAGLVYKPVDRAISGLVTASRPWIGKDARSQTSMSYRTRKDAVESMVRQELRSRAARTN